MIKGLVADIERFSTHDGPGIRTVVFLKGCPLRCAWCHNPECISYEPQELFYPERCIGCGKCAEGCYSGARVMCGREMCAEEVMEEVLRDRAYYGQIGGVTVSGGEPLAQPAFTRELIEACRREGISVAIESSMIRYDEELLSGIDLLMADIKVMDDGLHRTYTGVSNRRILENLRRADALGVPMLIRTPIIPGVNDTQKNIAETADFLRTLRHLRGYELLPYHPLGQSKAEALGLCRPAFSVPTKEKMEELRTYADLQGSLGGNAPHKN
ncbi:MAG: glycyl-radical enzyme activating protein [Ruminococcaceae bacterium]|nr:glycyl-radical enzyme activating protein [Oscillospiraceae bacterium]